FSARQGEAGTTLYKPAISGSRSGLPSRLSRTSSNARALSLVEIQPPSSSDVEPASSDVEEPPSPTGGSVIELASLDDAAPQTKGKVSNQSHSWTFPDGEVITIESSDEDNAGDVTLSQKTVMATPQASWTEPPEAPLPIPIYATEEETNGGSSTKKIWYDTESEGPMDTDGNGMSGDSDEGMSDLNQQVLPHELVPRALSNTFMPSQVGLGAQAQAGPSFTDQTAALVRNALNGLQRCYATAREWVE
ncbi:hypothetical protein FRC10_004207, partial [Ceratobasidium sp. 414]